MTNRTGTCHPPRRTRLSILLALLASASLAAAGTGAADPLESYRRARRVLDRGVEALGGGAATGLKALELRYEGDVVARLQSPSPDPPFLETSQEGRIVYEPGGRTYEELTTEFAGGLVLRFRRAYGGDEGWMLRLGERELIRLNPGNIGRLRSSALQQYLPHERVREALAGLASLRHAGSGRVGGQEVEWIQFPDSQGKTVQMAFSTATGLPLSEKALTTDIILGDTVLTAVYADYRTVDGIRIPYDLEFTLGGQPFFSRRITRARVLQELDESLYEIPGEVPLTEYAPRWKPRELADGVFAVRLWNGSGFTWNVLIVAFDDFVAVMEAPLSDLLHRAVTTLAGNVAPGKPIRYIIPTHHHQDHIAGLKAYMAAGSTVLSTPATVEFARAMARAPISLVPNPLDTLGGEEPPGGFETVEGHRVIRGGARELHLYDVGPNPHAGEILIAHLPEEKILFVTDLFSASASGHFGPPSEGLEAFARKLKELDLEVETIVPGHGAVSTMEDFRRALGAGGRP